MSEKEKTIEKERKAVLALLLQKTGLKYKDLVQAKLTEILGDQMITTWDKVWSDMTRGYVEVAKHVNYETAVKVKEANLRGVGRKETSRRVYPAGDLAADLRK